MEHFFTPTRRLPDQFSWHLYDEPLDYTELQLTVPIEAFMNHPWDRLDFRAFVACDEGEAGKILWITEDTFIYWIGDDISREEFACRLLADDFAIQQATFTATSGETKVLVLAKTTESKSAPLSAGASSVFWRAISTISNCVKLKLEDAYSSFGMCSGPALLQFLEASPSLELLEFEEVDFGEADCRALATLERTGLEVTFCSCSFDAQGEDTFIEWLRHSQGVTTLGVYTMDDSISSALSGNSSVKILSVGWPIDGTTHGYIDYDSILPLARALPGNQGIENLSVTLQSQILVRALPGNQSIEHLRVSLLSDETWRLLLRSLWAHPRIQSVRLTCDYWLSAAS